MHIKTVTRPLQSPVCYEKFRNFNLFLSVFSLSFQRFFGWHFCPSSFLGLLYVKAVKVNIVLNSR
jgi:hypothetical protein